MSNNTYGENTSYIQPLRAYWKIVFNLTAGALLLSLALVLCVHIYAGNEKAINRTANISIAKTLDKYVTAVGEVSRGAQPAEKYENMLGYRMVNDLTLIEQGAEDYGSTYSRAFPESILNFTINGLYVPGKKPMLYEPVFSDSKIPSDLQPVTGNICGAVVSGEAMMRSGKDKEPKQEKFIALVSGNSTISGICSYTRVHMFSPYSDGPGEELGSAPGARELQKADEELHRKGIIHAH